MTIIDFDNFDEWGPSLTDALKEYVPENFPKLLRERDPEYVEDARSVLFDLVGRDPVIDATLRWIERGIVVGYHGTRLTDVEVESIRSLGLLPLQAESRRTRLIRALSAHERWSEVEARLDEAIHSIGKAGQAGSREGQVHLTLPKVGLSEGFNHYLKYGSEFDYHAAHQLLGTEGHELLNKDGRAMLVRVGVPGHAALKAAHPYFSPAEIRARGDTPNIVEDFLEVWAFRFKKPTLRPRNVIVDSGMIFKEPIPAEWIIGVEEYEGML